MMSAANVSFKFKKTSKVQIVNSTNNDQDETKDLLYSLEGNKIKSSIADVKKKELIIPLIAKNNWRIQKQRDVDVKTLENRQPDRISAEHELEDAAAAEILSEVAKANKEWNERDQRTSTIEDIPLMKKNQVPDGFESDEKLDVSLRPEVSSLEQYEQVPIEEYGLAMLRGMGWKHGEGISKKKQVVKPIESVLRPKGLGLGADPKLVEKMKSEALKCDGEEGLSYVKGGFIKVESGPHRNLYGEIEGIDEDNSRIIVRLTLSDKVVTLSRFVVCLVTKKEYKREAKILNKSKYDEYVKIKETKSREVSVKNGQKRKNQEEGGHGGDHKKSKKSKKYSDAEDYRSTNSTPWAMPGLRVRIIDKKYQSGRYYKSKVKIEDVVSIDSCICCTDEGKLLYDVNPDRLETIVPKTDKANVMVVAGKHRNKICRIIERNKKECVASVQFLDDRSIIKTFHYDQICEYFDNDQSD